MINNNNYFYLCIRAKFPGTMFKICNRKKVSYAIFISIRNLFCMYVFGFHTTKLYCTSHRIYECMYVLCVTRII